MAKDNKFGTFGGVYTPSLLTILGVIMYLRLPWVVGHAGLLGVLGIIFVAHIISVATGLSISSIATDKNVGAGGPYYIVSRSLGLPIGGALGLALFVGLCFSTSLYVIGLSESILSTFSIEPTLPTIRITGTIALFFITAVTVVSTSFAIKTQYVVLGLILVSLGAIFFPGNPEFEPVANVETSPGMAALFGIFFPAVTGFTAGVNMSGDLKDPKSAIPRGTMLAIFSGLIVYVGLATFLHFRVPQDALVSDPNLLPRFARKLFGEEGSLLVVGGIWGATFSSGLGSIMGAPRILQALSVDRITPAVFAKGRGPTQEPRNALILAFFLAEAGILIAELNAIARIVSMVFLTMYAFLNISCAIEAKVSPDFRPAFRIPAMVSVVGAITCVVIMIQLDLAAMLGATALMVGLFLLLQRKQLELDAGDAWQGVWTALIRSSLFRVTTAAVKQQRNWTPNILAFHSEKGQQTGKSDLLLALINGNGLVTDFELQKGRPVAGARPSMAKDLASRAQQESSTTESKERKKKKKKREAAAAPLQELPIGVFNRRLAYEGSPFNEIQTVCQHYGFSGLEPNTLLLPWELGKQWTEDFAATVELAADQDFNVLVYKDEGKEATDESTSRRVDIWWRVDAGNAAFCIAILRFLTRAAEFHDAHLRFLLLSADSANNDNLRSTLRRHLRLGRLEAEIKIENDTYGEQTFVERVRRVSRDASLTILGLPTENGQLDPPFFDEMREMSEQLGRVLFVRGSGAFKEILPTGRAAAVSELPPLAHDGQLEELPKLNIIDVPDIASYVTSFSENYQKLVSRFSDQCLGKLYGRHVELIRDLKKSAEHHLAPSAIERSNNPRRKRTTFNRQQSSFLLECKEHLARFEKDELPDLHSIYEGGIDAFKNDENIRSEEPAFLNVSRDRADLAHQKGDSRFIRRFKRRRRWGAFFKRRNPQYRIPLSKLRRFYFQRAVAELLLPGTRGLASETHQLLVQLGKVLNATRAQVPDDDQEVELETVLAAQKTSLLARLDELDSRGKNFLREQRWALIVGALHITQDFADDISRFDFLPNLRKNRKPGSEIESEELAEIPPAWMKHQAQLVARAALSLSLGSVGHRLHAIVARQREAVKIGLKNGAQGQCQTVLGQLSDLAQKLSQGEMIAESVFHADAKSAFDGGPILENLVQECAGSTDELPAQLSTLSDDSIQALEEGRLAEVEQVELPVRRLVQFLVDTEIIGGFTEALRPIAHQEQRSLGIAQDVVRLVQFQMDEFDRADEDEPREAAAQILPVVQNGIERLTVEVEALSQLRDKVLTAIDEKLHLVNEGTNAYELSSASALIDQQLRVRKGRQAVSGARGAARRGIERVRAAAVGVIYGRSEGLLLARSRGHGPRPAEHAIDRMARAVRSLSPRPEVLSALPFYYRQLFVGQSGVNDTFWVGRTTQLAEAKLALKKFESGTSGCLLVTGDRLSGKTALIQKLASEQYSRQHVLRVHAPVGGTIDERLFCKALQKARGGDPLAAGSDRRGSSDAPKLSALFSALPRGSVVILDDLNLWWQRSPQGHLLIEQLLDAVDKGAGRILFVFAIETRALRLINRLVSVTDRALCTIECTPVPAEALKSIVTLRHGSTGMKYQLGLRTENEMGSIALARFFSSYFDHSGGSIGATLRAWIASIAKVKSDTLIIEQPARRDWESFDSLRPSWVALLVQLYLHKQMSFSRLSKVCPLPQHELRQALEPLLRTGIVSQSQRKILEIDPYVAPAIKERFEKLGWL